MTEHRSVCRSCRRDFRPNHSPATYTHHSVSRVECPFCGSRRIEVVPVSDGEMVECEGCGELVESDRDRLLDVCSSCTLELGGEP